MVRTAPEDPVPVGDLAHDSRRHPMTSTATAPQYRRSATRGFARAAIAVAVVASVGATGFLVYEVRDDDRPSLAPDSTEPTRDLTMMNGAFWAAEPPSESTVDLTLMYGAFWAAAPLGE
jgi:hypothetical protein